jgi:drug/metabolite transporter (DMT)-like permease
MRVPHTIGWGIGLALATAIISGFSIYLNGRVVKLFDDPTLLAAVRNGLVGLTLVLVAAGAGALPAVRTLSGRERLGLLAIGVIGGGIPFALFFEGLALSSSPAAAVIHKTLFLWVAVLAVPFLGERLGALPIAALALLLAGTIVLAPTGSIGTGPGELMILAATLCWAVEAVIARRLLRGRVPATLAAAARMTIGSLTLVAIAALTGGIGGVAAYGIDQWSAIVVTGLLLTGYVLTWYGALQRAPAATVTSVLVVGAVVTTGLQALTTGAAPAPGSLAGNLLLVGGCLLAIVAARTVVGRTVPATAPTWSSPTAPARLG